MARSTLWSTVLPDVLTKKQRSYCMSRIRGKDTKPEVQLRKALWRLGYRYRLASKLPGKPDFTLPRYRIAVFVDGCFWHKCPEHFILPKNNRQFWYKKISRNVRRDALVNAQLERSGWIVVRIWEHAIRANVLEETERIDKLIRSLGGGSNGKNHYSKN